MGKRGKGQNLPTRPKPPEKYPDDPEDNGKFKFVNM